MSSRYKRAHSWAVVANRAADTGEYTGSVNGNTEYCELCHKTRVLYPRPTIYKKSDPMGYYAYLERKGF